MWEGGAVTIDLIESIVSRDSISPTPPSSPSARSCTTWTGKDALFERAEAAGLAALVQGLAATTTDDAVRLERGSALFDALYASFRESASR